MEETKKEHLLQETRNEPAALPENTSNPKPNEQLEKAKQLEQTDAITAAYQSATSLWIYTGQEVYSRFNTMLVVHSVFLATIGLFLTTEKVISNTIPLILSIAGGFLTFLWASLNERNFVYAEYYTLKTREIEELHFPEISVQVGTKIDHKRISVASEGGKLKEKDKKVVLSIINPETKNPFEVEMTGIGRIRGVWTTRRIIGIFGLLYFLSIVYFLFSF